MLHGKQANAEEMLMQRTNSSGMYHRTKGSKQLAFWPSGLGFGPHLVGTHDPKWRYRRQWDGVLGEENGAVITGTGLALTYLDIQIV